MKIVSLLSGGLDSTVLLWHLRAAGHDVRCLSVDYGQRHRKELEAARIVATLANVEHRILDLSGLRGLFAGSALTDDVPVPHGHYTDASQRMTVVPNRNMVLLALAAAWALTAECGLVAYAAHGGDRAVYPDCRPRFVESLDAVLACCDHRPLGVYAPFLSMEKRQVVQYGRELGAPLEQTWSCYEGAEQPCTACGACVERAEALA